MSNCIYVRGPRERAELDNCLNMFGDDSIDALYDIEELFGITITDEEAGRTYTVGELFELIEEKRNEPTQSCLTQRAFYRLRRVTQTLGLKMPIKPTTTIEELEKINNGNIRKTWKRLGKASGLNLLALEGPMIFYRIRSLPHWAAWGAMLIVSLFVLIASHRVFGHRLSFFEFLITLTAFLASPILVELLLKRSIPTRIRTFGDLAREVAGYNFSKLSDTATSSRQDRWQALCSTLRGITNYPYVINRSTKFFAETRS